MRAMMSVQYSARTSPYVTGLVAELGGRCEVRWFSWVELVMTKPDVLHVHWPETFARGSCKPKAVLKALLFNTYLAIPRGRRAAIVWTVHNLSPHERGSWLERATIRHFERNVDVRIYLNRSPENNLKLSHRVGLHPLLEIPESKVADTTHATSAHVGLLYFGLMRPYKKVHELIQAFVSLKSTDADLHVVGEAEPQYAAQLIASAGGNDAVSLLLDRVSDEKLAEELSVCDIALIPGLNVYNSGAALLALGMDRPVMLARTPSTIALQREFGSEWVHLYDGSIDAGALSAAIANIRARRAILPGSIERPTPDPTRSWAQSTAEHLSAYRDATARSRKKRRHS